MKSLISFDGFADVANNLIDKVSGAVGWVATHDTPKREAVNTYIKEIQESDHDPLTKAALISNAKRAIKDYKNQRNVLQNATQFMLPTAKPQEVSEDWLAQFMDKARLVSDSEVQMIWGRILAEECNCPNSVPKGLLHVLEQMDRKNATDFSALCSVSVMLVDNRGVSFSPVFLGGEHKGFYENLGLEYDTLVDLAAIGLIEQDCSFDTGSYVVDQLIQPALVKYHDQEYALPADIAEIPVGCVIFTRLGQALCKALSPVKHETFFTDICIPFWEKRFNEGNS